MIAAENGALPGGKVGGIGDVVRDIPLALAHRDCTVSVVTPAYGSFLKLPSAKRKQSLMVNFGGSVQSLELYRLSKTGGKAKVRHAARFEWADSIDAYLTQLYKLPWLKYDHPKRSL